MSEFAQKVKGYYERGLWNEARVKNAVKKGAVSAEEFRAITGNDYSAE